MTPRVSRRTSRAAFWLVNAGLVALIVVALVEPVAAWFGARGAEIEEKADLLARYERALTGGAADRPVPAGVFVPGATDAVRAAALQEAVKRVAASTGVRVLSVSTLPLARERSGVVAIRVDLSGPMKAVGEAVGRIETGTPMVAVARTVIRASATREETAGELTPLDVQLDIVGFAAR